ncbi:MAG: SGNH/GDSL hydrolase family protein [Amphritea sp.]|nr:SGNH/GDSL hydrolase family protein [Amphritea sp.]MBQ0785650.1 SGNH/GDSL hydrolase family protein [Amphritea sp.]
MKQVLVYADSLSWGIIPDSRNRFEFHQRWPGKLEQLLSKESESIRVIEDCLNGRRTVLDDPFKPGRNGLKGLQQRVEINSPLALVIIMLGNNDFQSSHNFKAAEAAQGVAALIPVIRKAPIEPGMPMPEILLISPPPITCPKGTIASKFKGAELKWPGFNKELERIANENQCYFFDAGTVINASMVDGIHLDQEQHQQLAISLKQQVIDIFQR